MKNSTTEIVRQTGTEIGSFDVSIIVAYIVAILAIGCWAGIRKKNKQGDGNAAGDYFLAGGSLTWPVIGLALFATNISTVHLVSLAQAGFDTGFLNGNYEWMASFCLMILAIFFAPFYIRSRVATLPDFLEKRYSRASRDWLALLSIVSAIAIHIAFALFTGAVVLEGMFGFPKLYSIIGVALLTGVYTYVGGLKAVVITESIQTAVLLLGAMALTWFAWDKVGGWDEMVANIDADKLSMLKSGDHPSNSPWYAFLLGYPVLGIWYWCADQTIVQRVLGAKDENHARVGALFAGFIKILPVFLFILPGLMFYAMIQKGVLPENVMPSKMIDGNEVFEHGKRVVDSSQAYAVMIRELLPVGLKGLVAAALLSALMSTVSGALNSISTLVSYDIYKRFKPDTNDAQLVKIGRVACVVAIFISIAIAPQLGNDGFKDIINALNTMIGYVASPITAVFVCGVFWKRSSALASSSTLASGFVIALVLLIAKLLGYELFGKTPGLLVAFYLCLFFLAMMVVISLLSPHQHTKESEMLYWKNPLEALQGKAWSGIGNYKLLTFILFSTMSLLYWIFA